VLYRIDEQPTRPRAGEPELFRDLTRAPRRVGRAPQLLISVLAHVAAGALLVLLPIAFSQAPPPPRADARRIFLYDPPPAAAAPPLRGPGLLRAPPATASTPQPPRREPALVAPDTPIASPLEPRAGDAAGGDPDGSERGDPEGIPGGVPGGIVGGLPGGVPGGVIGGSGTGPALPVPVLRPDTPVRLLRKTRPVYPRDAFKRGTEGTVLLEILIDAHGRVARARVLGSIPALDEAALEAVRSWLFEPARHAGVPVATLAQAPITFSIY
jgi:protein TonB